MELRLRPPRADDEAEALAAHRELAADDFTFLLGRDEAGTWSRYLEMLERRRRGEELAGRLVPATFLLAEAGGELVGRASIRHELTPFLLHEGGHIGYCVRPAHRRRGHAGEILRQALIVARSVGVERVLVTCDEGNVASARAIERAGGRLEDVRRASNGIEKRRYWFEWTPGREDRSYASRRLEHERGRPAVTLTSAGRHDPSRLSVAAQQALSRRIEGVVMTTKRRTPKNMIAGGFVTAVLLGLGSSPAAAAQQPRRAHAPAPPHQAAAVLPVTGTRKEAFRVPTTAG